MLKGNAFFVKRIYKNPTSFPHSRLKLHFFRSAAEIATLHIFSKKPEPETDSGIQHISYFFFLPLWHMPAEGQFAHPQPHEVLPFRLSLSIFTTITAMIATTTAATNIVPQFSAKKLAIKRPPYKIRLLSFLLKSGSLYRA